MRDRMISTTTNKMHRPKISYPRGKPTGYSEIFPSDQPAPKKEFATSGGEFNPQRLNLKNNFLILLKIITCMF
jgi:hypothetical protein